MHDNKAVADLAPQAKHTEIVSVFFDDLDAFGMVHHGKFATLLERSITSYFTRQGLTLGHPDLNVVVRELTITFDRPVTSIGTVRVTLWLEKLGRTSASFGFQFHSNDQPASVIHAHGTRVVVKIDPASGQPAPWTVPTRELLTAQFMENE